MKTLERIPKNTALMIWEICGKCQGENKRWLLRQNSNMKIVGFKNQSASENEKTAEASNNKLLYRHV